jgi:hypothetical protein
MAESPSLIINGKDARKEWGIVTTSNTLGALLAPPSMKSMPTFEVRLEHGVRYDTSSPRMDARQLNLELQLTAPDVATFYARLSSFVRTLVNNPKFELYTDDRPDVVYNLIYQSCQTFTQFCRGIATLSLKCVEPDPSQRAPISTTSSDT